MSDTLPTNYTPIETNVSSNSIPPDKNHIPTNPRKINIPNILLISGIIVLILSVSYAVHVNQLSNRSRASELITPTPILKHFIVENPTLRIKEFPSTYKEEPIPEELFSSIEEKYGDLKDKRSREYVIDRIVRFYAYRDILQENSIEFTESTKSAALERLADDVKTMERTITDSLLLIPTFPYKNVNQIVEAYIENFK